MGQTISASLRAYGTARYLHKKVSNSGSPCNRPIIKLLVVFHIERDGRAPTSHLYGRENLGLQKFWCFPFFPWHNRLILDSVFGFAAALLETFPIVGILFRCANLQTQLIDFLTTFSVSNQVGAAMWAHGKPTALHNHAGISCKLIRSGETSNKIPLWRIEATPPTHCAG